MNETCLLVIQALEDWRATLKIMWTLEHQAIESFIGGEAPDHIFEEDLPLDCHDILDQRFDLTRSCL